MLYETEERRSSVRPQDVKRDWHRARKGGMIPRGREDAREWEIIGTGLGRGKLFLVGIVYLESF